MTAKSFILADDLVIPAGTPVAAGSRRIHYIAVPAEILVSLSTHETASVRFDFAEALKKGIIIKKPRHGG